MDQNNQTTQEDIPSYFNLEPHKREEVLAQIGSFSQVQYQIFHNICAFWEPVLDYNKYILKTKKAALIGQNQLELLFNKIQDARMGLLQYKLVGDELKPQQIILTEKDSLQFYYYTSEEILSRNFLENGHPFITIKSFDKFGLVLPEEYITPLEPGILGPGFHREMKSKRIIYGITRRNRSPILIPSGMLDEYLSFLIKNLIRESQSMTLLENVSRLGNIKISELQKKMNTRNPSFWIRFTKTLIDYREDLKIRIKGISPLIFTSARLLQAYFSNSLLEMKEKKLELGKRQKAQEEIISDIREKGIHWTAINVLEETLNEKDKIWDGFRLEFKESVLKKQESGDYPALILLNGQIIHKDYLFPFFRRELKHIGLELHTLYQGMMTDLLRNGQNEKYSQFYSRNNFKADIMNRIRNKSPLLKELLQKPVLMGGVGYYYYKNLKGVKRNNTIRDSLHFYFKSDMKQYQDIDQILQLSLISLFDRSFDLLSWWSRFILKITGKYESYTSSFARTSAISTIPRASLPEKDNGIRQLSESPPHSGQAGRHRKAVEKPKVHSIREKTKAWAEFNDAINKKK